jgi:uncharacterized membrane protein
VTWATRFRVGQYLKGSLWVLPLAGGVAGVLLGLLDLELEEVVTPPWDFSASTADTVLAAIIGAMVGLTGFVVTVTVLMVQMATGTFSARYMRLWYRDRLLKLVLALLLLTLTFSFSLLTTVETDSVPNLGVTTAGFLVVATLGLFMLFLDVYIHRLRPVAVASLVAARCRQAVEANVGAAGYASPADLSPAADTVTDVVCAEHGGAIQALHSEGLVNWPPTVNACSSCATGWATSSPPASR